MNPATRMRGSVPRPGRGRRASLVAGAVVAVVATACSSTVAGTAVPVGAGGDFDRLLTECDDIDPAKIAETVGADAIDQGFYGAICRWDAQGTSGPIAVTFNWFEWGSLDIERDTATRLGYTVSDVTVEHRAAIEVRIPDDPGSCSVTTDALRRGVFGWWVQYHGAPPVDPCEASTTLARLTLGLNV